MGDREGGREHSTHSTEEKERNLLMMAAKEGRKEGRQLLPFNSLGKVDRPFEGAGERVRERQKIIEGKEEGVVLEV